MNTSSEAILALKPVTFHYKSDQTGTPQYGLIAEEVTKVNPDLVVRDEQGKSYTVRCDAVNAMLLNEFLKEHRTVQEQQNEIDKAKIGNTGPSFGPHLHFGLLNRPDIFTGRSLPFVIDSYTLAGTVDIKASQGDTLGSPRIRSRFGPPIPSTAASKISPSSTSNISVPECRQTMGEFIVWFIRSWFSAMHRSNQSFEIPRLATVCNLVKRCATIASCIEKSVALSI